MFFLSFFLDFLIEVLVIGISDFMGDVIGVMVMFLLVLSMEEFVLKVVFFIFVKILVSVWEDFYGFGGWYVIVMMVNMSIENMNIEKYMLFISLISFCLMGFVGFIFFIYLKF